MYYYNQNHYILSIVTLYVLLGVCIENNEAFTVGTITTKTTRYAFVNRKVASVVRYNTAIPTAPTDVKSVDSQTRFDGDNSSNNDNNNDEINESLSLLPTYLRVPLKYVGPYPCLALRFPNLATSNQRSKNISGIALDFVLDTAANINTINAAVAQELQLPIVGQALPGVGSAGLIQGGASTYLLGDATLERIFDDESLDNVTFITNLTASALPIASPAAAGLLSLQFFQSIPGGVEFTWGNHIVVNKQMNTSTMTIPSITFYDETFDLTQHSKQWKKVPIHRIPVTELPTITIEINGIAMSALLDSGSPITIIDPSVATAAQIETISIPGVTDATTTSYKPRGLNPFGGLSKQIEVNKAIARGDVLQIMGSNGQPTNLIKSNTAVPVTIHNENDDSIDFDATPIYVGELPGLAALKGGLGMEESPVAVILGMDVLRKRPSMLLRALQNEVWFE